MRIPKIERFIGIETYATHSNGIGGTIRDKTEDFAVEEILVDGSKANIDFSKAAMTGSVLGSSQTRKRYLLSVMMKQNCDTFAAVKHLSLSLNIRNNQIHFAGLKDAKATTSQYITLENVTIDQVKGIQLRNIHAIPIGYLTKKLSPYYLLGNYFQVKIRNIASSKSEIKKRIEQTCSELHVAGGMPNFFGHQRFGTTRPITHLVGKALVKGRLDNAAMLYLSKSFPTEHPGIRQARDDLQDSQDFQQALASFPTQLRYERIMLKHLVEHRNDFAGAFRRLPLKLRQLFPQAYQSFLFNKFLSCRMTENHSLKDFEEGDYIIAIEQSGLPISRSERTIDSGNLQGARKSASINRCCLALPIIGFHQKTSAGIQGEIEKRILEAEDVDPKDFKLKNLRDMSLRGQLRSATTQIRDLSYVLSSITRPISDKSIVTNFALQRGSYASVLLREIMKVRNPIKAGY